MKIVSTRSCVRARALFSTKIRRTNIVNINDHQPIKLLFRTNDMKWNSAHKRNTIRHTSLHACFIYLFYSFSWSNSIFVRIRFWLAISFSSCCVKQHTNKRLLRLCKCVYLSVYMRWWWFMFGQSYSTHLTFVMYSVSCFYPVWRYMNNRLLCIFPFSVYPFLSITVIRYFWHNRTHIYAYKMNIY